MAKLKIPKRYPKSLIFNGEEYKIKFVKKFADENTVGECDYSEREIRIKKGQSPKETYKTFIHECLHAMEEEFKIPMKHEVIYKMEEAFFRFLIDNSVI